MAGVRLSAGTLHATTDAQGRFLLTGVPAGEQVMRLDGRHAVAGADPAADYGFYEVQVSATAGRTTALPWVDWLPRIDHAHDVTLASPVAAPVVVTTPAIANLELRIPKGAVLTDPDGKLVTHVGITSISTRRPPFPLPRNVDVPVYFTAQPGGTVISSADGTWLGAQVVYPNYHNQLPRARQTFWKYEPDTAGWAPYGAGTVTADARQVVPDPLVRIYELDGAMMRGPNPPPPAVCNGTVCPGPPHNKRPPADNPDNNKPNDGEPVDLSLGAFLQTHTDFSVDDVMPIGITRSYTSTDTTQYAFGAGMSFAYDIHLYGINEYQTSYLVLPGGESVYYTRTPASITGSCGVGCWSGAVFTTTTPGAYFNSTITYNGDGWNLVRQDGMVLIFGDNAPLAAIQDRFGNRITLTRAGGSQTGLLTQISSPNGRFITLAYQNAQNPNVVTSATDNVGRTFTYGYDPTGRMLQTVTDPNGGVTIYTWSSNYQVQSIQDARKNTFITNAYDTNLRVHQQTLADTTSSYTFNYTLGNYCYSVGSSTQCNITETDVVDPNANTRKVTFDGNFSVLTDNSAVGTASEIDLTYCRSGDTNAAACPTSSGVPAGYLVDYIDGLNSDTHYSYDANANTVGITYLFGTSSAVTYNYTYSPTYNLIASLTDPLGHTTSITRPEPLEEATSVTDPLNQSFSLSYNLQGEITTIADAMTPANMTTLTYDHGDLSAVTDPLGHNLSFYTDAIGRSVRTTDALGNVSTAIWDPIDGVQQGIDPNGALTTISFDPNGNASSVVDALTHKTSYTYTSRDQLQTRTDPDLLVDHLTKYDPNGNLLTKIDRKGQTTTRTYDALNRISTATYADGSVVSYTWDKANRLTQIADSAGNTISRFYDGLNNLLCETPSSVSSCMATAANTLTYTYDAASRRQTMTVAGQPQVTYTYDAANRLTKIVQGSVTVTKTYDNDNRAATLTYPSGLQATYSFDNASELTGITYTQASKTVGTLTYLYDLDGRVATRGGTLFQSVLPGAVAGAAYDPDNRLCAWNIASASCSSPTITWDSNGNLLNDGSRTYAWDSRNRLKTISGVSAAYVYDAAGRRLQKTIGAKATKYAYDFLNIVQEQQGGTPFANLFTGLGVDERFSRTVVSTGVTGEFATDALGSIVGLVSTAGAVNVNLAYTPFGVATISGSTTSSTYQFTGREADGTGLLYNRARYYNPNWGRFVSEDPIRFSGGINFYTYAANNPLNESDLSGLAPCSISGSNLADIARSRADGKQNRGNCARSVRKDFADASGGDGTDFVPHLGNGGTPSFDTVGAALVGSGCYQPAPPGYTAKPGDAEVTEGNGTGHVSIDGTNGWNADGVSANANPGGRGYGPGSQTQVYQFIGPP